MILRKILRSSYLLPVLLIISCEKFSGDQTIPGYISIDSLYITSNYQTQGTASQNITDVWIYIDDEFLGAYELPARFPILKSGVHTLKVWSGIKKNGISTTRTAYEYFQPFQKNITLGEDSITKLGVLKTTYQPSAFFQWLEDFESVSLSLDTTSRSIASIEKTHSGSPLTFEGAHSGMVVMDSLHSFFECQTHLDYPIPGSTVFLEMNFNTSNSLTVGLILYSGVNLTQSPIITLNPTGGKWKKIYIDLTTTLNAYAGMSSYRVFLGTFKDSGMSSSVILFDNFKIVTHNTFSSLGSTAKPRVDQATNE
jgi:hypothetical protein